MVNAVIVVILMAALTLSVVALIRDRGQNLIAWLAAGVSAALIVWLV